MPRDSTPDRYCRVCNVTLSHLESGVCIVHMGAPAGGCRDLDQRWGGRDPKVDGVRLCVLWPNCDCGGGFRPKRATPKNDATNKPTP